MKRCWVLLNEDRFCCLFLASVSASHCLTSCLSDFAHVGSHLNFFIPRGSNQWNCTHISASLPFHLLWYFHGFMLLYFCFGLSWYTAQVFPNAFRHSKRSFSVMLCKSPQWMNSRQCLLSTVSNCSCKVIQQGFMCRWLDKCFCHFSENFLLLLSSDFSSFCLFVMCRW